MHLLHVGLRLQRGRYELLAPIGQGGTGVVWRALDHKEARSVALKLLPAPEGVPGARPEVARAAVEREAEVARNLTHPGMCQVWHTFEDGGWACVVMELCARSLADRVEDEGPLSPDDALVVLDDVAGVLRAAHALGIVHRDVKPQNILLRDDGSVALADWGLAHARSASGTARTTATTLLGTLPFMAPEVRVDPMAASPASDTYALGITLAWACTGTLPGEPYVAEVREALRGALREDVLDLVVAACAWAPEARGWRVPRGSAQRQRTKPAIEGRARVERMLAVAHGARSTRQPAERMPGGGMRQPWAWGIAVTTTILGVAASYVAPSIATQMTSSSKHDLLPPDCEAHVSGFVQVHRNGPAEGVGATAYDVNVDRGMEVVVAYQMAKTLEVVARPGTPTSAVVASVSIGRAGSSPVVGDINGDAWPDIVVPEPDEVALRLLYGGPGFYLSEGTPIVQPEEVRRVRIADVDGDGKNDVLIDPRGVLAWRRGDGRGTFGGQQPLVPSSTTWIATLNDTAAVIHDGANYKLLPLPLQERRATEEIDARDWPQQLTSAAFLDADVDQDGTSELYIVDSDRGAILMWRPTHETCTVVKGNLPFRTGLPVAAADLDNDRLVDFITVETCRGCTTSISSWLGTN